MLTLSTSCGYPVRMARRGSDRPVRKRPDRYHHGDLRRALLQAAVHTIARDGVQALTLRGVGSMLGVSRTALYRHFTDKAALLAAVAAEGFRMLRTQLTEAWESGGRGVPGFQAMGRAYVQFAVAHPSHYRVMFGASTPGTTRGEHADEGGGAFQVLVDALADLQRQTRARQDDLREMAMFVWATVHGVAMLAIDGRLGGEAAAVARLTDYTVERIVAAIQLSSG